MWGPWTWGATEGSWWVFPLVGFIVCLAFLFLMLRLVSGGHGCMCMGGHRRTDESADLRRELEALRGEVGQLRASRPG